MANIQLINRDILPPAIVDELDNLVTQLNAYLVLATTSTASTVVTSSTGLSVGTIVLWPSVTIPAHWQLCDGTALSRVNFQSLFQAIGTTFGAGDGNTTFNVPDLRQKFPMGVAASGTGSALAATGGNIDHTHTFSGTQSPTTGNDGGSGTTFPQGSGANVTVAAHTHTHPVTVTISGTTGTANPPFMALNFIILTQ